MEFDIRGIHVELTDGIRNHVQGKLTKLASRFERVVRSLHVHLEDVNGPKGGADKQCKLLVTLRNAEQVVIDERDGDLYAAIDKSVDRLKQVLSRRVNKMPHSHTRDRTSASGLSHTSQ